MGDSQDKGNGRIHLPQWLRDVLRAVAVMALGGVFTMGGGAIYGHWERGKAIEDNAAAIERNTEFRRSMKEEKLPEIHGHIGSLQRVTSNNSEKLDKAEQERGELQDAVQKMQEAASRIEADINAMRRRMDREAEARANVIEPDLRDAI